MLLWHSLTMEQVNQALRTTRIGLRQAEASARLKHFGLNRPQLHKTPLWQTLLEPFRSIFVVVLVAAAAVSFFSDRPLDSIIIGSIIIINAVIFYGQQYTSSRVLRNLKSHSVQTVRVLRDGIVREISSYELVPGDVITLGEGERIPADARLLEVENLQLDESSLTGESLPVAKTVSVLAAAKPLYERSNMVFQGTHVTAGTARAAVVETGSRTEFGAIAKMASQPDEKSPVQQKIDALITKIIGVVAVLSVVVFSLSLLRGIAPEEALRFALSLSVAAVPEGLPVALTVIILLGMRRMAKKQALVRNFKAIEDIGLVTVIVTDKTGTLTKNRLRVVEHWPAIGKSPKAAIAKSLGDPTSSDPLDRATSEYANSKPGQAAQKTYPFEQSLRMSGAGWKEGGGYAIYLKGSPEHIISRSDLTPSQKKEADRHLNNYTAQGYRVLAVAQLSVAVLPEKLDAIKTQKLKFVGLIAFADEIRPEAAPAVAEAHRAGIKVKLVTGDHFDTAHHVARQVGLAAHRDQMASAVSLPKDMDDLARILKAKSVFARVLPRDKFNILKALKSSEITAMTGDGVNDVPALRSAHVGVAMGSGSDIAKDTSGIVLLDNNFASLIKAVAEGRIIYDNIRRMLFYLLSTNLGEALTMVGALLAGLPLPVTAVQILWINIVTDSTIALPLGLEPAEQDHMRKPPRKPKEPILSRLLVHRMILVALTMAIVTLVAVKILLERGYGTAAIQTTAFMMLIVAQWANALNARSESRSLWQSLKRPNLGLAIGLLVSVGLQLLVMFGPLSEAFGIELTGDSFIWWACAAMAVAILAVVELHKLLVRRGLKKDSK